MFFTKTMQLADIIVYKLCQNLSHNNRKLLTIGDVDNGEDSNNGGTLEIFLLFITHPKSYIKWN